MLKLQNQKPYLILSDEEMIKVATWLVELSRGSFNHNNAEPSDNNSVILEENVNDINEKTVDVFFIETCPRRCIWKLHQDSHMALVKEKGAD